VLDWKQCAALGSGGAVAADREARHGARRRRRDPPQAAHHKGGAGVRTRTRRPLSAIVYRHTSGHNVPFPAKLQLELQPSQLWQLWLCAYTPRLKPLKLSPLYLEHAAVVAVVLSLKPFKLSPRGTSNMLKLSYHLARRAQRELSFHWVPQNMLK